MHKTRKQLVKKSFEKSLKKVFSKKTIYSFIALHTEGKKCSEKKQFIWTSRETLGNQPNKIKEIKLLVFSTLYY